MNAMPQIERCMRRQLGPWAWDAVLAETYERMTAVTERLLAETRNGPNLMLSNGGPYSFHVLSLKP